MKDKRKEPRNKSGATAWIRLDGGFSLRPCVIDDVSRSGMRLRVDAPAIVPQRFTLSLSRGALQGYSCQVKWRSGCFLGVEIQQRA